MYFGTFALKKSDKKKMWTMSKWIDIQKDFWTASSDKIIRYSQKILSVKMFQYFIIVCVKKHCSVIIGSWYFSSSSGMQKFYYFWYVTLLKLILGIFFKCFTFFKLDMPSQKLDKNNSTRIIFIKIIIKVNIIKIYVKNTHFIARK